MDNVSYMRDGKTCKLCKQQMMLSVEANAICCN